MSTENSGKRVRGKPFEKGHKYAWKKGQSGNPGGRPRDTISPHIREIVQRKYPGKNATTYGWLIAQALVDAAVSGELAAIREVIDRLDGKPRQGIDLTIQQKKREMVEAAVEQLMQDAGLDRDEAISQLSTFAPEISELIN